VIDFELTPEQRAIRDLAREFVRREIIPIAAEYDEREEFPLDVVAKAHEVGLMYLQVPREYGGQGLDHVTGVLVSEEMAYGCLGINGGVGGTGLGLTPLLLAGTEAQKQELLPPLCERGGLAAFCLTEAQAGSDVAAIQTAARRVGDEYVLNGTKRFTTNGGIADLYTVFASVDRSLGHKGLVALMVPGDTPGVRGGKKEKKMGDRAAHVAETVFEEARVPVSYRLGNEGDGFRIAMQTLDYTRPGVGASAVGVGRRAFEEARAYATQRKQFGRAIAEFQAIQFVLADMAMSLDAARLLVWRAARRLDQGRPSPLESAMAKCFASDVAMRVTTDAVQILGGYGYIREYPVEKLMRDAKITQIYEGTNQVLRLVMARQLLRQL